MGGLAFWLLAARLVEVDVVGESQALYQAIIFVNYVGNLGLPLAIAKFAGPDDANLANWITSVRVSAAAISTALFMVIAARADLLDPIWEMGTLAGGFTFLVLGVGLGLAVLMEARLMTLRLWKWVVIRGAVAALGRLPLLIPLLLGDLDGQRGSFWLFVVVTVPVALSGYGAAVALRVTRDHTSHLVPRRPPETSELSRFAAVNWAGLIATQGPVFAVPLIVAFTVDSAANAPFYVAWSFGAIAFVVPQVIGQVTLSEASQDGSADAKLLHALRLALVLTCVASVGAQFTAGVLARIYGPDYAEMADTIPLLVVASIAWSYVALALTASRIRGQHIEQLLLSGTFLLTTMVPTLILTPSRGPEAAIWCWLAGNVTTALLAAFLHFRWKLANNDPLFTSSQPTEFVP